MPTQVPGSSSAFWEVLQRPAELGADYLFFLPAPTAEAAGGLPRFEISHPMAWKRLGYETCYVGTLARFYDPRHVNLPDGLRGDECIVQSIPLVGTLTHGPELVREDRLFHLLRGVVGRE